MDAKQAREITKDNISKRESINLKNLINITNKNIRFSAEHGCYCTMLDDYIYPSGYKIYNKELEKYYEKLGYFVYIEKTTNALYIDWDDNLNTQIRIFNIIVFLSAIIVVSIIFYILFYI